MFCSDCGGGLSGSPKFCPNCGANIAVQMSEVQFDELTEVLMNTHLGNLVGLGSAPADRAIIEESLTKLFNELQMSTVGGICFTYDPITRACTSDTVDEFADSIVPGAIYQIMLSGKVHESILPCISTFLNWFVSSLDIPIDPQTQHAIFLNNLKDEVSDANLTFFGFTTNLELVKTFYLDNFSEGTAEFFELLKVIVEKSKPGEIEVLPGNQPWFAVGTDRKELWGHARDAFQQSFYPVKTSVEAVLASTDWLKEHLAFLQANQNAFLTQEYVGLIQCQESVSGNKSPISGKDKILLFSDQIICEIYTKEKHRRGTSPILISRGEVTEISIGTEIHESHAGYASKVSTFMVFTIHTSNYQIRTLRAYMGDTEQQLNASRPGIMQMLEHISKFYPLVEGDVAQSSSGYTLTPSVGFWHIVD